jgi:hypothetical protein
MLGLDIDRMNTILGTRRSEIGIRTSPSGNIQQKEKLTANYHKSPTGNSPVFDLRKQCSGNCRHAGKSPDISSGSFWKYSSQQKLYSITSGLFGLDSFPSWTDRQSVWLVQIVTDQAHGFIEGSLVFIRDQPPR